jgi:RNA polymerase primary sigma factor
VIRAWNSTDITETFKMAKAAAKKAPAKKAAAKKPAKKAAKKK